MKIFHINTNDLSGGAARAAYRLNKSLNMCGVESCMLVNKKTSDEANILVTSQKTKDKALSKITPLLDRIPLKFYNSKTKGLFSPAWGGIDITKHPRLIEADIIHLHWINNGFLSLKSIEKLKKLNKPIVWTLHDMWAFTGGCHYSDNCIKYTEACGNCPLLDSKRQRDLSRRIWDRKRKIYKDMNLTVVTCSKWLGGCAQNSSLLSSKNIRVIPNTLEMDVFKPINSRIAREILNLPEDKFIILFGAMSATSDKRKGFSYLAESINTLVSVNPELKNRAEILVFGATHSKDIESLPLNVNFLGNLGDNTTLSLCYNAADVFIAPSLEDNLPNTVMESLSCGTPVVAFNIGGMPDMIEHKTNGYLADSISPESLSEGISFFLEDSSNQDVFEKNSRESVVKSYRKDIVAKQYIEVYEEILKYKG